MSKKTVKKAKVDFVGEAEPQVESAPVLLGKAVLYVLDSGPNAGAIRQATLIDQGGAHESIEVQTEPGDELPMPLSLSLDQHPGDVKQAPVWNGEHLPGTWHWPAK